MGCSYCLAFPAPGVVAHDTIRCCPQLGAICKTCGTRSAKCVGGACRKQCAYDRALFRAIQNSKPKVSHMYCVAGTRCNRYGHTKANCAEAKKPVVCHVCGGHHRSDSAKCPQRAQNSSSKRTCSECRSTQHIRGVNCPLLFDNYCKGYPTVPKKDARQLFEESFRKKCSICNSTDHTAIKCSKTRPPSTVAVGCARAVLEQAGCPISSESSGKELRQQAHAIVMNFENRDAHEAQAKLERQSATIDALIAYSKLEAKCQQSGVVPRSRNLKLRKWQDNQQREHKRQRKEHKRQRTDPPSAQRYESALQELLQAQDDCQEQLCRFNTVADTSGLGNVTDHAVIRHELGLLDDRERHCKALEREVHANRPDMQRAWRQRCGDSVEEDDVILSRDEAKATLGLVDDDPPAVSFSTRYYRRLLNASSGARNKTRTTDERYLTQRLNDSMGLTMERNAHRGASAIRADTPCDVDYARPYCIAAPNQVPIDDARFPFKVCPSVEWSYSTKEIKPRDLGSSLKRHKKLFFEQQQRSETIRRIDYPTEAERSLSLQGCRSRLATRSERSRAAGTRKDKPMTF